MSQNRRIYTEEELEKNTMKKSEEEIAEIRERQDRLKQFDSLAESDIPSYLSDGAKEEFKRILPYIKEMHASKLDSQTVAQYCTLVDVSRELTEEINQNGAMVDGKVNPALKVYQNVQKELRATASMLGLNMSSRAKLIADIQKVKVDEIEKEAEEDYFAEKFAK